MAKSSVYFISVSDSDDKEMVKSKFVRLIEESKVLDFSVKCKTAAVKVHFGEEGNTGFVKPDYVRFVCAKLIAKGIKPSVADTNTLYLGRRTSVEKHLELAREHGFSDEAVGAPVVIAEDGDGGVEIGQKFVKTAKIAPFFQSADAITAVSHFKGHIMTGFGGALKNLGMGCATREGKLQQHSDVAPFIYMDSCVGCGVCVKVCPTRAISSRDKKAYVDAAKCIGCATCIAVCAHHCIDVKWEAGAGNIQEKMTEYCSAVLKGKEKTSAFFNFAGKITKECDCLAKDDPKISPDVGIFASTDPVAIDKACVDSVNKTCGRDIFKEVHPARDWSRQLKHASSIGLGSFDYELIEVK